MGKKSLLRMIAIAIVALGLFCGLSYYFDKANLNANLKKEKKYCYQTYWKAINPVLYVEDEKNIDSLVKYYREVEAGNKHAVFNFPVLVVPIDTCVHILEYMKNAPVAKIICYYQIDGRSRSISGFVYKNNLHDTPPDLK